MIIYGFMNRKLKNTDINDVPNNKINSILKDKGINIK